ncbi:MAG: response regulator [Chloroflexi bacterium]|nr:response regulator [Chloroflexota bacterium]
MATIEEMTMSLFIACEFIWIIVVLLRQTIRLSMQAAPSGSRPAAWRTIVQPQGKPANAARSFALVMLTPMVLGILSMLNVICIVCNDVYTTTVNLGLLFLFFTFVMVYLNHAPEPTTLLIKWLLGTMLALLIVLNLVTQIITPSYETLYDIERRSDVERTQAALLALNSTAPLRADMLPPQVAYVIARPSFPPDPAHAYAALYVRDSRFDVQLVNQHALLVRNKFIDYLGAGNLPLSECNCHQNLIPVHAAHVAKLRQANPQLTLDQANLQAAHDLEREMWIDPPGMPVRFNRQVGDDFYAYYNTARFVRGDETFEIGFEYSDYRAFIHQNILPLALLTIAASLAVILVFPLFFRTNLIQPLNNLLDGVRQVNTGRRDVSVPVQFQDEVGFLTSSFNRMVATVRRTDELKDEFLANTSHELRTPLNGLVGIAESMLDGATGALTPVQTHNLNLVAASGRRLTSLVNDILDFSKLKHHELALQIKPISVYALADVVLALSQPLVGKKDLRLVNVIPRDVPAVDADENRVQQILHNLVGNAIKFTESGTVTLSAETRGKFLAITVADTGIGIATDKFEQIFESFEQTDGSVAREYGGTGLGLAISQNLVALHGGEIGVESQVGHGSRFTFTLPLSHTPSATLYQLPTELVRVNPIDVTPMESPRALDATGFNILVVDDEVVNRQVLVNQLSLQGFVVTQATNGPEALALIDHGMRPDLMILDIMMPRMSGYEVCQRVREKFAANEMPVVMLTAKNQVADLVEGFSRGANDYLVKPFSKNELLARIQTHLRLAKINVASSRFVPYEFLRLLGEESIVDVRLGDHTQMAMSVLFSDIRGYTTLSEGMTPKQNFDFLNEYLSYISPAIREQHGFIDQYYGDGIKALFPEQAEDALRAAINLRRALRHFNQACQQRGEKSIQIGIGLHTSTLMVGTIGEDPRMTVTVIGDAVNTTARLEGLNKLYGTTLIASEQLRSALTNATWYHMRSLGRIQVKGKQASLAVFEVFDGDDEPLMSLKEETRADLERGLQFYQAAQFRQARQCFADVLAHFPADQAARVYFTRAEHFIAQGTPEDWSGVEVLMEK